MQTKVCVCVCVHNQRNRGHEFERARPVTLEMLEGGKERGETCNYILILKNRYFLKTTYRKQQRYFVLIFLKQKGEIEDKEACLGSN